MENVLKNAVSVMRPRFISMKFLVACAIENGDCNSCKQLFLTTFPSKMEIVGWLLGNKIAHQSLLSNGLCVSNKDLGFA